MGCGASMRCNLRRVVLGVVVLAALLAYEPVYVGLPIEGTVIDAETKQPLAGVSVGATWLLTSPAGSKYTRMIHVDSTMTDATGRFRLPTWGPKLRTGWMAGLAPSEPDVIAFKEDYLPVRLPRNSRYPRFPTFRGWYWDGKPIALERATDRDEYSARLRWFYDNVHGLVINRQCDWLEMPELTSALATAMDAVWAEDRKWRSSWGGTKPSSSWPPNEQEFGCTVSQRRFRE